jgi:hypothetical protein
MGLLLLMAGLSLSRAVAWCSAALYPGPSRLFGFGAIVARFTEAVSVRRAEVLSSMDTDGNNEAVNCRSSGATLGLKSPYVASSRSSSD